MTTARRRCMSVRGFSTGTSGGRERRLGATGKPVAPTSPAMAMAALAAAATGTVTRAFPCLRLALSATC